jgi:hypothetical protein
VPDEDAIRRLVVEEVHNQVGPIKSTVDRLDRTVRSLYSNGSGGPPGFLEIARDEDKRDKEKLFGLIEKIDNRVDSFDNFVTEQKAIREERKRADEERAATIKSDLDAANAKLGMRISKRDLLFAIASLVIAVFMAWIGWREYIRKTSVVSPPPVVQSQPKPLDSRNSDH